MWSELPPQLQIPHLHRPHGQSHMMHLCHAVLMAFFVPRYGTLPDQLVGSWSAGKHNLCTARRTCTSVSSGNAIGSGSPATFSKRLYPCGHDASGVRNQCAAKRRGVRGTAVGVRHIQVCSSCDSHWTNSSVSTNHSWQVCKLPATRCAPCDARVSMAARRRAVEHDAPSVHEAFTDTIGEVRNRLQVRGWRACHGSRLTT